MTIRFIAEIIPHGKERARQAMRNGYVHSYTPKKTVEFERAIAWAYKAAYRGAQMPQDAPLSINVTSYIPIPKSAPKRLRELYASERVYHTKKPDASNILKSVEDALNGIAYSDDAQIADTRSVKFYSERPRVEVTIRTLGRE